MQQQQPKEDKQLSPFFAFYLVVGMQIGVGVLGFERIIAEYAGQDSWIAVLLSGFTIHIILSVSYLILNKGRDDLVTIQKNVFGKWFGSFLSFYFVLYYAFFVLTVLRTYVEIIQVWMFPELMAWVPSLLLLLLAYTYVTAGLRVVTGIAVIGFFLGLPIFLMKYAAIMDATPSNLLPVLEHSFTDLMSATRAMTLNYLGFEVIFMIYPFFKQAPKSQKWAQLGVAFTTFIYLISIIVSLLYFNQIQLANTIWATLTTWKIVNLAIAERAEYIGISIWLFVVLPNLCLGLWAASRAVKQTLPISQRNALRGVCLLIFASSFLFMSRETIDRLNDVASSIGFYTVYGYIPFLFLTQAIVYRVRRR